MRIHIWKQACTIFFIAFFHDITIAQQKTPYQQEINTWHKTRVASLLAPNGWLNLAGLFWLKPGRNAFGRGIGNELVYKHPGFPKKAGYFDWDGIQVHWVSANGVKIIINDSAVTHAVVFRDGTTQASVIALGSFRWSVIKRNDKMGVRLRNLASPALKTFKGINRFAVKEQWRVQAHLETGMQNNILITNVVGQTNAEISPGKLVFTIGGVIYKLAALIEEGKLFIIFGDATSGKGTYPAGRFLYAEMPDLNGNTVLDFNKAYNPPCAFSEFATCPLPPKQNILRLAITAGEKDYIMYGTK